MSTDRIKIYFAGSISGGRADAALYLEIIALLNNYGTVLTEHLGDESLDALGEGSDRRAIHDRDLEWLRTADLLVAEVTIPSLGVGYELGKMTEWGKPALCLYRPGDGRSLSAMIGGSLGIQVCEYRDISELKKIFDEFFRVG